MKVLNAILFSFLKLFGGRAFANPRIHPKTLLKSFMNQKLLRKNSRVHWPVHPTTVVKSPDKIDPGTRCPGLSHGCYLDGRNGISFGENTWVGPNVSIISMNHDINDYHRYIEEDGIEIGDNCWIGAGAIILPGVKLGNHIVVGAGSVVTKSFLESDIAIAGNPAKKIKTLSPYGEQGDS